MKKSLFFKLLCVFSFVFGLFSVSTGLSDYIIDKTTYDENGTLSNKATSANDNGEKVTVSFKLQFIESKTMPEYGEFNYDGSSFGTAQNPIKVDSGAWNYAKYNRIRDFMNNKTDSSAFSGEEIGEGQYNFKGKAGTDLAKYDFELNVLERIYKGRLGTSYGKYYLLRMDKSAVVHNYRNEDSDVRCYINKNEFLSHSVLLDAFSGDNFSGYSFCGLKVVSSDGSITDTYYDMSKPVTSNIILCAVFQKKNEPSLDLSEITSTINNAASNATIEFFKGAPSGRDISKDPGYNEKENIVYLGTSSLKTTVQKGTTIRFNMNNGVENQSLDMNGANVNIEPEDGKHELQYIVALANDLIVNGAFTIGGHFGTNTNSGTESHLVKEYVCLDLNGHDIYVESSGELWSYGLIKDSVGTGHIYINGGILKTLATVMDYRGGDCTSNAVSDNVFPFVSYALPYLRATTILNYTKSGWGKLIAICNITPSSYSAKAKFEIQFVGPSSGDYLFKINKDKGTIGKSKLIIQPFNLNTSGETDNMCVQRKLKLTMIDMELSMASISLSISSYKVNTIDYNFPVNPFFDVELKSTKMYFAQKMQFSTGMSFIADENSTVIFDTNKDRSAQLSVLDRPYNYWDNKSNSFVDNDNIGQMGYSVPLHNNKSFWKLNSVPKIKIYGKLLFRTNNGTTDVKLYKLVGPIDFNERKIGYIDASDTETIFSSTTDSNPFSFLKNNNVHIQTYGFDYMLGYYHSKKPLTGETYKNYQAKGFARPLRSNGVAYVVDEQQVDIGTYDGENGIYQSNNSGKTYYFNCDGSYALGDNGTCTVKECTIDGNFILDGNEKYIYFASMYGKFNESTNKVDMSRIMGDLYVTNGEQMVSVKYDSIRNKWLRG